MKKLLTKLEQLLKTDHCDCCGDDSCDITASFENGQTLWSAHLLLSAGAASEELEQTYKKLKVTRKQLKTECSQFIKDVSYSECTDCGSVNWNTDENEVNYCRNCAATYGPKPKETQRSEQ